MIVYPENRLEGGWEAASPRAFTIPGFAVHPALLKKRMIPVITLQNETIMTE